MQERRAASVLRIAFVMEQTLGHVTHAQNLRAALRHRAEVAPTWIPIEFGVSGATRFVPVLSSNWSLRASWRARRALGQHLARKRHDALFFHTQVTSLLSVDLMQRYPTVISLDATPINYDTVGRSYGHRPAGDGFLDRRKYAMNRRAYHAAAGLVTWSEWAKRSLIADYGVESGRVEALAPGAAVEYFAIGQKRNSSGTAAHGRVKVLFVGGDFNRKGGPVLLDALNGRLADECELHVVTRDTVQPRSNVHVHYGLGPNSPELLRLFEEADVFVLPSLGECLAVVLMEATAAGLPIITTDVGALREAVVPDESGFVVVPGDPRDLHTALERLVSDPGRRARMGRAGYALAMQKFHSQRNNARLLDLITQTTHQVQPRLKRTA